MTSDDFPASRRVPIELDAARAAVTPPVTGRRALRRADSEAPVEAVRPSVNPVDNDDWSVFRGSEFRGTTWYDADSSADGGPSPSRELVPFAGWSTPTGNDNSDAGEADPAGEAAEFSEPDERHGYRRSRAADVDESAGVEGFAAGDEREGPDGLSLGRQWSDRDTDDEPELDRSAAYRATLPGLRSDAAAAQRRKAREALRALEAETAAGAAGPDADANPLFSSTDVSPSDAADAHDAPDAAGLDISALDFTVGEDHGAPTDEDDETTTPPGPVGENPLYQLMAYRQMVESLRAEIEAFGAPEPADPSVEEPVQVDLTVTEVGAADVDEAEVLPPDGAGPAGFDRDLLGREGPEALSPAPDGVPRERAGRGSHRAGRRTAEHQPSADRGRHAAARSARHRTP